MTMRSNPMPKAKPLYSSGSMPQLCSTLRVYHTAAQNLDPALALAQAAALAVAVEALNVQLGGRLGEREVVRAEADDGVCRRTVS